LITSSERPLSAAARTLVQLVTDRHPASRPQRTGDGG
jgi:hypothetical protein